MKPILHITSILLFLVAILFANPSSVLADEGEAGHSLEMEVNGYHITLASQNDWVQGANTLVVTLTDSMGMPVRDTKVELLIEPTVDEHAENETDSQGAEQQHESMPGMNIGAPPEETPAHAEENAGPISMTESDEHGMYVVETHFESSGTHAVHVMFHANGEMLQGDFVVEVSGITPKTIILWSFAAVNVALVATAGVIKKQKTVTVKGA
jgi:hypothetical protein